MITCVAFSADGLTLASGSADGVVKLWKLECKAMTKAQWKYQEEKRLENVRREAEQKRRKEEEEKAEKHLRQQEQWRSEGRCEICEERIGFSFTRKTRCKKHQQYNGLHS